MKKLLSTVLIACLALSAIACNNTKNEESTDTTDFTTRETETQITPDFSEPNQSIASSVATTETETSSSETATPTQSGAYTYEAYGYQFSMDVNLEDYYFTDVRNGVDAFDLYYLARDYGWRPHRANGNTSYDDNMSMVDWYEYDFGDGKVMIVYVGVDGSSNNPTGFSQVSLIGYNFRNNPVTDGMPYGTSCYDSNTQQNSMYWSSTLGLPNHASGSDWFSLYGGPSASGSLSREDVIILAYLITVGPQHPGENPFYYSDFVNSEYYSGSAGNYTLPY